MATKGLIGDSLGCIPCFRIRCPSESTSEDEQHPVRSDIGAPLDGSVERSCGLQDAYIYLGASDAEKNHSLPIVVDSPPVGVVNLNLKIVVDSPNIDVVSLDLKGKKSV